MNSQLIEAVCSVIVADKDFTGRRRWSELLGVPAHVGSVGDLIGQLQPGNTIPSRALVVLHAGLVDIQRYATLAPRAWIAVAITGDGWREEDARTIPNPRCYLRRLPEQSWAGVEDLAFKACWTRFTENLNFENPDFGLLDPRGIPETLLAWAILHRVKETVGDLPELDTQRLRDDYNLLFDGTDYRQRGNVPRLSATEAPTADNAIHLLRSARVDV